MCWKGGEIILKTTALSLVLILLLSTISFAAFDKKVAYPGKTLAPVTFDHGKHLKQKDVTCKSCHPGVFAKMKAGANKVNMADINKGKFCGVCHKEKAKAFAIAKNCAKCHVKAQSLSSSFSA